MAPSGAFHYFVYILVFHKVKYNPMSKKEFSAKLLSVGYTTNYSGRDRIMYVNGNPTGFNCDDLQADLGLSFKVVAQ